MRTLVLTVTVALALGTGLLASADERSRGDSRGDAAVVVHDAAGKALAHVPLTGTSFAVSYRNSIYGTSAEERYEVLDDGRFELVSIAADQLAVLEEYYAVPDPPRRTKPPDRRQWVVPPDPARPLVLHRLVIAATELGRRTLHVPGEAPLPLWPLAPDDPTVVLEIEGVT